MRGGEGGNDNIRRYRSEKKIKYCLNIRENNTQYGGKLFETHARPCRVYFYTRARDDNIFNATVFPARRVQRPRKIIIIIFVIIIIFFVLIT